MAAKHRKEHSAGIVVFRDDGILSFLCAHSVKHNEWGFPKGHLEGDETAGEAARRELLEEVGPLEVEELPGFHETTFYPVEVEGRKIVKRVDWFLARHISGEPQTTDEVDRVGWWSAAQVFGSDMYPLLKEVIKKAMRFAITKGRTVQDGN